MNLSRLFHCSVIKVLCVLLLFSNFCILSDIQVFVNNFFIFYFVALFLRQLNHIIIIIIVCQQLFYVFLIDSGEGGI